MSARASAIAKSFFIGARLLSHELSGLSDVQTRTVLHNSLLNIVANIAPIDRRDLNLSRGALGALFFSRVFRLAIAGITKLGKFSSRPNKRSRKSNRNENARICFIKCLPSLICDYFHRICDSGCVLVTSNVIDSKALAGTATLALARSGCPQQLKEVRN